jgi:hypothetical protein
MYDVRYMKCNVYNYCQAELVEAGFDKLSLTVRTEYLPSNQGYDQPE